MKKILTGVKPTGESMHLGNLLGAVLPFQELSKGNDGTIFIADLHALTSVKDAETLRKQTQEVAVEYMSILPEEVVIFRQSDIHHLGKLNWVLNNFTPYSLMLRAHSFKDSENKKIDLNMGVFNYPILMAADIIGYDTDIVPVGKDQKQHLEMARDIARNVNKTYKANIFKEPREYINPDIETIPGLDGRKMSKSYNNFIGVFDDEKTLKKKIMSIPTDSKGLEEKKDPDTCNIFALIAYFGTSEEQEEIRKKYLAGNYGYGHAKLALLDILSRYTKDYREKRKKILQTPEKIEAWLKKWAEIMNKKMQVIIDRIEKYIGINF